MLYDIPEKLGLVLSVTDFLKLHEWHDVEGTYIALMAKCVDGEPESVLNVGDVVSIQNVIPMSDMCYQCIDHLLKHGKIESYYFVEVKKSHFDNWVVCLFTDQRIQSPAVQSNYINDQWYSSEIHLDGNKLSLNLVKPLYAVIKEKTVNYINEEMISLYLEDGFKLSNTKVITTLI